MLFSVDTMENPKRDFVTVVNVLSFDLAPIKKL